MRPLAGLIVGFNNQSATACSSYGEPSFFVSSYCRIDLRIGPVMLRLRADVVARTFWDVGSYVSTKPVKPPRGGASTYLVSLFNSF